MIGEVLVPYTFRHRYAKASHGYVISVLDVLRSIDGLKLAISTISID